MRDQFLHNPQCSKSRAALELLTERGAAPTVREYVTTAPTVDELRELVTLLGVRPAAIVRRNEATYRDSGMNVDAMSDEAVLELIAANPILLERPIYVRGGRAVIGRPPENVLTLLDSD